MTVNEAWFGFSVLTRRRGGKRCYKSASSDLRQLAGQLVRVESGPRVLDPGGQLLYYVYTEAGNSIDEMVIREGLACAWTRDGQHRDHLVGLEREARELGVGCLW